MSSRWRRGHWRGVVRLEGERWLAAAVCLNGNPHPLAPVPGESRLRLLAVVRARISAARLNQEWRRAVRQNLRDARLARRAGWHSPSARAFWALAPFAPLAVVMWWVLR